MGAIFYLKNTTDGDPLIMLRYNYGYSRFNYSTKIRIEEELWDANAKRARRLKKYPKLSMINRSLDLIDEELKNIVLRLRSEGKPITNNLLKEHLDIALGHTVRVERSFLAHFDEYIEFKKERVGERIAKTYRNAKKKLLEFRSSVDYSDIDYKFSQDFISFMEGKGYSVNYIGKILRTIVSVSSSALKLGLTEERGFEKIRIPSEEVPHVYLSEAEIQKLLDLKLSKGKERVRDVFVIGCFTGLRVGNYSKLNIEANLKDSMLKVVAVKNGPKLNIPLRQVVKDIFAKYDKIPNFTDTHINREIKKIAEKAGLVDVFEWSRTEGGRRVIKRNFKWELITTHTARRSFATNAYKAGIQAKLIMQITGHKSEKDFFKYISITQEESAEILAAHEFFR